jgi:hypothetical protein
MLPLIKSKKPGLPTDLEAKGLFLQNHELQTHGSGLRASAAISVTLLQLIHGLPIQKNWFYSLYRGISNVGLCYLFLRIFLIKLNIFTSQFKSVATFIRSSTITENVSISQDDDMDSNAKRQGA